jgi:fumarylpyruvate hydrolase
MNSLIIPEPKLTLIPIKDSSQQFPVRRIYCIGRNYADHAIEMGFDPNKEDPFFFQKNADNVDTSGNFPYPPQTSDVHHEIELVVALKSGGSNISLTESYKHVLGFGVGLDMTRRDLQGQAKKTGRPWEIGKSFEHSAPMGKITLIEESGTMESGSIVLKVNDVIKQQGDLNMMIWKIPEMISHLSQFYKLQAGDLIMTGTPAGVGAVKKGDILEGSIQNLPNLKVTVI